MILGKDKISIKILYCAAKKTRENLKIDCENLKKCGIIPKLAVIMVGDNPASKVYVKNKNRACEEVGIEFEEYLLNEEKDATSSGILCHFHSADTADPQFKI